MATVRNEDDRATFARKARDVPGQRVVQQQILPGLAAAIHFGVDIHRTDRAVVPSRWLIGWFDEILLVAIRRIHIGEERAVPGIVKDEKVSALRHLILLDDPLEDRSIGRPLV